MHSTQKSDWSAETIRERGDVIVEELIEELEEDLRSVRSEFSSQQATFQSQINLLTDASAAQRREILAKLDERREQLSTYQAEIGAARAEARRAAVGRDTRVGQLEESISDFADEVARLTAERDEVTEEVNVLEAQSRAKADQKLLEERGARESGESGRGPRWRELDREHDIIKANLEVVQNRLDRIEQELQNASDALLSGRQQLAVVRDAGDAEAVDEALDANNDVRVKFLRDEIADLRAQADALNFPQLDFTDGRVTEDDINKIERACTQIKSELITAQANDDLGTSPASQFDPGAIDCTSGGAFETARQFSSLQDSLTLIRDECRAQSSEVYESVQGGELLQYVRNNCINESALPAKDKAIFLADLRRVARTRDPDAAPIAYAFVALQDREPQAIFSLTLALAADLLILIVSLFGNAGKHVPAPAAATLAPAPRREQLPEPEPEPQPDDKPRDPFDNLFKNS